MRPYDNSVIISAVNVATQKVRVKRGIPPLKAGDIISWSKAIIDAYFDMEAPERSVVRTAMNLLGLNSVSGALQSAPTERLNHAEVSPSFCPYVGVMVKPCALTECSLHISRENDSLNCLRVASDMQAVPLSSVARLLGLSVERVNKILAGVLRRAREQAISAAISSGELSQEFVFLRHKEACGACENRIGTPYKVVSEIAFCSPACAEKVNDVLIEARYGVSSHSVMKWLQKNFTTESAIQQALSTKTE